MNKQNRRHSSRIGGGFVFLGQKASPSGSSEAILDGHDCRGKSYHYSLAPIRVPEREEQNR